MDVKEKKARRRPSFSIGYSGRLHLKSLVQSNGWHLENPEVISTTRISAIGSSKGPWDSRSCHIDFSNIQIKTHPAKGIKPPQTPPQPLSGASAEEETDLQDALWYVYSFYLFYAYVLGFLHTKEPFSWIIKMFESWPQDFFDVSLFQRALSTKVYLALPKISARLNVWA